MVGNSVTNFKMVVADWGSAIVARIQLPRILGYLKGENLSENFAGGTPVYAGPQTFEEVGYYITEQIDVFAFGRLAMELMMSKSGTESKPRFNTTRK